MASCTTTKWVSYSPQIRLTLTAGSSDGDSVTWSWKLEYYAYSAASTNGNGRAYKAVIDDSTVASGSFNINGKKGWNTIKSGSKTINRTHSAKTVKFSCEMDFDLTWSGVYCGTRSASGSTSMSAQTSYKVTYNSNGGSGAPASQTKWYGDTLTLSSTKPTRTGHSFKGWGLSTSDTTVDYAPGASYTKNASDTLYAIWTANTYKVTYNANGGSGAPAQQTKTYGKTLTLSSTKPTRTNYTFKGWAKSSSGAVAYAAGASYTTNAAITLYAVWELAYTKPRITDMTVNRCDSAGNLSASGTSVKVTAKWSTDQTIKSIQVLYKKSSETTYKTTTVAATGTSGTINTIVGANGIGLDATWNIQLVVADQSGSSFAVKNVSGTSYVWHAKKGGKAIAFGKPAEIDNVADFEYTARFQKTPEFMISGRARKPITMFSGDANGDGISIGAGGAIVIGSGESSSVIQNNSGIAGGTENVLIGADGLVRIFSNLQNGFEERKEISFDKRGRINLLHQNDVGFMATHATTGKQVGCGVGSGGQNRGIHDTSLGSWIIYRDSAGTTNVVTSSDARFKDNLGEIPEEEMLAVLNGLEAINFIYKDDEDGVVQNGFIAQNVRDTLINNDIGYRSYLLINDDQEKYTDLYTPEDEIKYGLDYSKFTPLLVKGWQYHEQKIKELEDRIETLYKDLEAIKNG